MAMLTAGSLASGLHWAAQTAVSTIHAASRSLCTVATVGLLAYRSDHLHVESSILQALNMRVTNVLHSLAQVVEVGERPVASLVEDSKGQTRST